MLNPESVKLPRKVVWAVAGSQDRKVLGFDWHQVARKSWVAGQGLGRNLGLDQRKGFAFVGTSLADSP